MTLEPLWTWARGRSSRSKPLCTSLGARVRRPRQPAVSDAEGSVSRGEFVRAHGDGAPAVEVDLDTQSLHLTSNAVNTKITDAELPGLADHRVRQLPDHVVRKVGTPQQVIPTRVATNWIPRSVQQRIIGREDSNLVVLHSGLH